MQMCDLCLQWMLLLLLDRQVLLELQSWLQIGSLCFSLRMSWPTREVYQQVFALCSQADPWHCACGSVGRSHNNTTDLVHSVALVQLALSSV